MALLGNGTRATAPRGAAGPTVYAQVDAVSGYGHGFGDGPSSNKWGIDYATYYARAGQAYAPLAAAAGTVATYSNTGIYHDSGGQLLGQVTLNTVGVAYARVHLFLRENGAWIGSTTCDASGNYAFYGLDRNVVSDNGYLVTGFQPNGAGTQYDAQSHDRLIPG